MLQETFSSCMASQHHSQLSKHWTLCTLLLLTTALLVCDARTSRKRPLIRAKESERIPNSYFVHIRQSVSLEELKEMVQDLNNQSSQGGAFKASVSAIITRAAYGFPARFSPEALDYVSIESGKHNCSSILRIWGQFEQRLSMCCRLYLFSAFLQAL